MLPTLFGYMYLSICFLSSEKHTFQLRAYLFQARNLIGSDDSGLSDPFARVIFGTHCKSTQVQNETLNPMWDQTLCFDDVVLYGPMEHILKDPPVILVEFFDHDAFVSI